MEELCAEHIMHSKRVMASHELWGFWRALVTHSLTAEIETRLQKLKLDRGKCQDLCLVNFLGKLQLMKLKVLDNAYI